MTALKGKAIKAFLQSRDKAIDAVLVYGPDSGLVKERAELLARRITPDFSDAFNYIELTDADLKDEPARLSDECVALSFTGGERVVRLRTAGEASAKSVAAFLDGLDSGHLKPNGMVIIEAGELSPRSGLRKAFEKAKRAVALPCYADAPADIRDMAKNMAAAEGLRIDDDALDLLAAHLGDDHGISRSEIEKLILYKGLAGQRDDAATVTVEDVRASLVGAFGDAMDDVSAACADGAPARLAEALHRALAGGAAPIGLLRAMQRQFSRLQMASKFIDGGDAPPAAMKKLKPPVFFAEQRAFERRLQKWRGGKVDQALRMLIEAELAAKSTGAPQREIIERTALRLSVMAAR